MRGGSSAIAINHCGYDGTNTMMSGGCDGTMSDNYDGSKGYERSNTLVTMLDGYNGSSGTMADGYDGSNPMATMADAYNGSNPMAICRRGSPSPPPFLSPPTQTAVESGS